MTKFNMWDSFKLVIYQNIIHKESENNKIGNVQTGNCEKLLLFSFENGADFDPREDLDSPGRKSGMTFVLRMWTWPLTSITCQSTQLPMMNNDTKFGELLGRLTQKKSSLYISDQRKSSRILPEAVRAVWEPCLPRGIIRCTMYSSSRYNSFLLRMKCYKVLNNYCKHNVIFVQWCMLPYCYSFHDTMYVWIFSKSMSKWHYENTVLGLYPLENTKYYEKKLKIIPCMWIFIKMSGSSVLLRPFLWRREPSTKF